MPRPKRPLQDRLLERIRVDAAGCFLWQGSLVNGYGNIWYNGRSDRAHRLSYETFRGPVPPGLCVCHDCDVRACINPAHLFLGTKLDNAWDAVAKGRFRHSEAHRSAKLTAEQVVAIVARYNAGEGAADLSAEYGISRKSLMAILHGRHWQRVFKPAAVVRNTGSPGEKHPSARLSESDVIAIRAQRAAGRTHQSIADEYGVSVRTIGSACSRTTWSHVP